MNGFKYDPHTHTCEVSHCAHMHAAEIVEHYAECGFSGIVVTDHLHQGFIDKVDTDHNWEHVIDCWLEGYHASKKRGEELGLDILLGVELRFPQNKNDYLVYGIDEDWMYRNPYMCCTSPQDFYEKHHDEVLIIHAHPYRDGNEVVFEDTVQGTEIINGNPRHDNYNDKALELARRHPDWYRLAGSDTHDDGDWAKAGVILPERVTDSFAFKKMIEEHRFELWSDVFADIVEEGRC